MQGRDPLRSPGQHEAGLAGPQAGAGSVQVALILLDLDGHRRDIIVELPVMGDLSSEAPIPHVGHGLLEYLEVGSRPCEHVSEPRREWFKRGVDAVVRGRIKVDDVRLLVGTLGTVVTRHGAVIVESYPLGFLIEAVADRDLEVSDLPGIELIPLRWMVESFLVVEDLLLEVVEVILVPLGGHTRTGLVVGDGLEETIGDGSQHGVVDVGVRLEGRADGARREGHRRGETSAGRKLDGCLIW